MTHYDQTFNVADHIDSQDFTFVEEQLIAFNIAATGYHDDRDLAILVRDDQGAICAGLTGWTWGDRPAAERTLAMLSGMVS